MTTAGTLAIVLMLCSLTCSTSGAASRRPSDAWSYYHFDGAEFKAGPAVNGSAFIAVRERVQPMVLLEKSSNIEPVDLAADSGAVAGICYYQRSGGKLGGGTGGYAACVRSELMISSSGKSYKKLQTDDYGYFVTVLPAGTYMIGSGAFINEFTVDNGATTIIPLKAGKRMVD